MIYTKIGFVKQNNFIVRIYQQGYKKRNDEGMGNEVDIYFLRNKWMEEIVKKFQKIEYQVIVYGWYDFFYFFTYKFNGRLEIESEEIGWKFKVRGYIYVKYVG